MIDFEKFLLFGTFGSIDKGANQELIIQTFGEPDILTPARKSYPTMIVYGDVEFRLRKDNLTGIALSLEEEQPDLPETMAFENLPNKQERSFQSIEKLLEINRVNWTKDDLMSFEDEDQLAYVTGAGVYLGFTNKNLMRIVTKYS
jgi:hypothetical protein